jgi:NAD(P)-dependent dehydrogenase (short-subunit alcohol dehydrogenase family)
MATRPRHVLITGGSRGIGLSIAQLFAKNAYRCTLISRSEDDLRAAVATLQPLPSPSDTITESAHQYTHGYVSGNITASKTFWSHSPKTPFGAHLPSPRLEPSSKIDVLVNCAGMTQAKLFTALDEGDMVRILNTNLVALMYGTKFLLRHSYMFDKRKEEEEQRFSPVVINVSSLLGLQGGYGAVAYAASKAGVLGFTRALATEYASHRVRVNAIVPGYVETDMTKGTYAPSQPSEAV